MSVLLVIEGVQAGRRFNLRQRTRIGRAMDNEIVLTDNMVSRYHVEIIRSGPDFDLRDLGSKNGITVNRTAVTEKRLRRGDILQVGQTRFLFEIPAQTRTARFSESTVHLESIADESLRLVPPAQLDFPPSSPEQAFASCLSRFFQSPPEMLPEALNDVLRALMKCFGATAGTILIRNGAGDAMPLVAVAEAREAHLSNDAVQRVFSDAQPALVGALTLADDHLRLRPQRALIAPLLRHERVFGALQLERPKGREFAVEDLAWLQVYASLAAAAVQYVTQTDQWVLDATPSTQSSMIIGVSGPTRALREQVRRVASSDATVLLTGETGTGKDLAARAIHAASPRAAARFIAIDCSAIPANLMESELFGYEAGAFTGADRLKQGKVELAEGGTLFLDEIGELQLDLQPKLLRFLEELVFYRVGGIRPIHADVRIIAATNRDLEKLVAEGRFRDDLLFRLNVMLIRLPPLRTRPEDIRPLVNYFAPHLATRVGKSFLGLDDTTWAHLERYAWPGNVRELLHGLERALILSDDGIIRPEHFQITAPPAEAEAAAEELEGLDEDQTASRIIPATGGKKPPTMAEVEAEAIRRALRFAGGNRVRAAEILQIHRNTLAKKIQDYKIDL